jgi:hypothetical protein
MSVDMRSLKVGDVVETSESFSMYRGPWIKRGTRLLVTEVEDLSPGPEAQRRVGMKINLVPGATTYVFGTDCGDRFDLVEPCGCGEKMMGGLRMPHELVERQVVETETCRACLERGLRENPVAWRLYVSWMDSIGKEIGK